jgi:hypothetical protein
VAEALRALAEADVEVVGVAVVARADKPLITCWKG